MILTVTLNPSVDISYKVEQFNLDTVNRVGDVSKTAGGKGLNVTRVLRQLGEETAATGFLGGSLGDFIHQQVHALDVQDHFVNVAGETRNCIAIIHEGQQTEILEGGPEITEHEAKLFVEQFSTSIEAAHYVAISGSQPKGLASDFYVGLVEVAQRNDVPVLLDTSGKSLELVLKSAHKPFLIKPNQEELSALFEEEVDNEAQIVKVLQNSMFEGITWIVVTLGADGALIKQENAIYRVRIPKVEAINPVGSGDSVIAGFAAGLSRQLTGEDLMKFGLSMGVLNAMEEKTGSVNPEKIDWCIEQMQVEKIK